MQWLIDIVKEWIEAQGYLTACFVDRGDPSSCDYTLGDLTADDGFHTLDLSAIVPAGAKAVSLEAHAKNSYAGQFIIFRQPGNTQLYNIAYLAMIVANVTCSGDFVVTLDANRKIEYVMAAAGWLDACLTVKGWWY